MSFVYLIQGGAIFNRFDDVSVLSTVQSYRIEDKIPPIIHRLLLYDSYFPLNVDHFIDTSMEMQSQFLHILWRSQDLLSIMNKLERLIYLGYSKNIQRADFGRYIVLKYYGGIYVDHDVEFFQPLDMIYKDHLMMRAHSSLKPS
jgi:mannosyltransferase OCH1-like enzyme